MSYSASQSKPLIGNLSAAFDFMNKNISYCGIYAISYPRYQIPSDQYQKICQVITKIKTYTGIGSERIEIPLFEIPILDKKLEGHNPTFLIGGWLEFKDGKLIGYSYLISIAFSTESKHQKKYLHQGKRNINAQSCCLSKRPDTKRIVRKIHFDYDQSQEDVNLRKHMQIGGKFPEHHFSDIAHAKFHFCLEHFLEEPRIPMPLYDFVLLLDLMIRQFHTPLDEWKDEDDWKKIVDESRRIVSELN
jgi:hypothetical protein